MEKKLGLSALTALVLSSMLGAGVFSLPQNMAAVASPAALLIGWGITGPAPDAAVDTRRQGSVRRSLGCQRSPA